MTHFFAAVNMHVSLTAEPVFRIGSVAITNSMILGAVGTVIVLIIMLAAARMVKRGKTNRFVGLFRWAFDSLYGQVTDIITDRKLARSIAPLAITIFFFTLINYWLSILPGVGTITWDGVPIFRALVADLNFTTTLAIITIVAVQVYAIKSMGLIGNAKRYLRNPFKDPIGSFEGFLELIGEFSRGLALSFRLFGNAFAGEILLMVAGLLTGYFASLALPFFMVFELFIGFIQAYVFFILTVIFTSLAQETHGAHDDDHSHSKLKHAESKQE
jgi:F-type H+-transporting ATPase subunit a